MKIAMLSQVYPPPAVSGAAISVQKLSAELAQRGHQVMVVTASDLGPAYRKADGNLEFLRLRSFANPFRVGTRMSPAVGWAASEAILDFRPDLIHLHDPSALGLRGVRLAGRLGVPAVYSVHQLPWFITASFKSLQGLRRPVEALLWRYGGWMVSRCFASVVPTRTIADEFNARLGIEPHVISYGVDRKVFSPEDAEAGEADLLRAKYRILPEIPVILHVGRLDADKNVEQVLRAALEVIRRRPAQLVIVGDGTQRKNLEQLSHRLGIGDRTMFTGFVPASGDLPGLYRLASAFVTASEIETLGIVLLEAMASGLPVAAVQATCIPELIRDGINGRLAPVGEAGALAGCIRELLDNPSLAAEMGHNGRRLSEEHDIRRTYDLFEGLYLQVLRHEVNEFDPVIQKSRGASLAAND